MKLSTASRISLGFTVLAMLIMSVISFAIFNTFSRGWVKSEKNIVAETLRLSERWWPTPLHQALSKRFKQTVSLPNTDPLVKDLRTDKSGYWRITHDRRTYLYAKNATTTVLRDVTMQVKRQQELLRYFLLALLWWGLLSFVLGKRFVSWALKDLHTLTAKIEDLHIDKLSFGHQLDHLPEHDEIRVLAKTLSSMTDTLHYQVDDIKQFVSNAAHELRTPLMIIRSGSEVMMKTQEYEKTLPKIMSTIDQMEGLISTLLLLARSSTNGFEKKQLDAQALLTSTLQQLEEKWATKNITVNYSGDTTIIAAHQWSLERVFHNLLDNAFKYTPEEWTISVQLDQTWCTIADTWKWITQKDLAHIWKAFWQADSSRWEDGWFWLWLSLVKRLVDLHTRTIDVTSSDTWTTFSLLWK